jgi:hypothetical protein
MLTNLWIIVDVVARSCRVLNLHDVCMFGDVCSPLAHDATVANAGDNALHQFKLGYMPMMHDVISHISTLLVWTLESRSGPVRSSDPLLIQFTISFLNSFPVHLTLSQPIPLFGNPCYRLLSYLCILFSY